MLARKLFIAVFLGLLIFSCKKKEFPEPKNDGAVFYASAEVNNVPVSFSAGNNGYYMLTSFNQNSENLYTFVSELKPKNCTNNCPYSLRFEFFDNQISSQGGTSNILNSIRQGLIPYYDSLNSILTPSSFIVKFSSSFNKVAYTHNWLFGDGGTSTLASPSHTYYTPGTYNVCYDVSHGQGSSGICNVFKINNSNNSLRTAINVDQVSGNGVQFSHVSTGNSNNTYLWDFGDGNFSTLENPYHLYPASGIFLACLTVKNNSDSAKHTYYVNTDSSSVAAPNFKVESITPVYNSTNSVNNLFGKIRISFTDENGVVYKTDTKPQAMNNSFTINSITDYELNENNQKTKKLNISFNCRVFRGDDVIEIKNGKAVIAIAYP